MDERGHKIWFDSKWEANVFRFYRSKGVYLERDTPVFSFPPNRFKIKAYVPDFYDKYSKKPYYLEVKGQWDEASLAKIRLMQTHYPRVRIHYIGKQEYRAIEKYYASSIPGWEY